VPAHCRMRGFDRDLIRGGHYGQRSCEPRKKAEHMAAPTKPAIVKKALANAEPSTHGTKPTCYSVVATSAFEVTTDAKCSVRAFPLLTQRRSGGLLDDFIRACEHRGRDVEAKSLGSRERR
jgi:hypothetical protein